jgi:putative hydrolase of the HAD superfamily
LFHTLTGPESEWSDLPWTADVLGIPRQRWNELLTQHSRWRLAGEERDPYRILSTLALQVDPTISDETIRHALRVRVQRFSDCFARVPGENVQTLQQLRAAGFKLGLISNADAMEVAPWSGSPLAGLFDVEIFSCMVGCVKPEPAIYDACVRMLGLTAEECLFVGDGGSNELEGAKAVGMSAVFVSGVMSELWPERVNERLRVCDHHVVRIPEVLSLLEAAKEGSA